MRYVQEGTIAVRGLNEGLKKAERFRRNLVDLIRKIMIENWSIDEFGSWRKVIGLKTGYTTNEYKLISGNIEAKRLFTVADAAWKPCVEFAEDNNRKDIGWETYSRWTNINLISRSKGNVEFIERGFKKAKKDWYANKNS